MNIQKLLIKAGVPEARIPAAMASLAEAKKRAKGNAIAKWKVRLFKAGKIAKMLPWEAERLLDVAPDKADWDIEPMVNITAHGDNVPWNEATHRPVPGQWLNKDPDSDEYKQAVSACYWSRGNHPRSSKARKDWYRRNGGAYRVWRLGAPVDLVFGVDTWRSVDGDVTVLCCGDAWLLNAKRAVVPIRVGYEIDNVWRDEGTQLWYPIPSHDLRAPVTWSIFTRL